MTLEADLTALHTVSDNLSTAALDLDAVMVAPAIGDVGAAAAVLGDIFATFGAATTTLINAADGAGITISRTATAYDETDAAASADFHRMQDALP